MAGQPPAKNQTALERARALGQRFAAAGFAPVEPAILLPADLFVDLSGEDIRRRLFTVTDGAGAELCLRPDFTIPVARAYVEDKAPAPARYSYAGPAFRLRRAANGGSAKSEFQQAGIEIFGAENGEAAELEVLRLALETVMAEGLARFDLRLGDPGLFAAILDRLDLPDTWRRRLRRHFWRHDLPQDLARAIARPAAGAGQEALAAALATLDKRAAAELVEEVLALAGIVPVGGRSAEEIAVRFMERAGADAPAVSERTVRIVRAYLEIAGPPQAAIDAIARLVRDEGLDLEAEVEGLARRLAACEHLVASLCPGQARATFEAEFGRRLEYYAGLVFEIRDPQRPDLDQIAGGGRYDRLLSDLGLREPLPAVGCAIYVDRLMAAVEGGR